MEHNTERTGSEGRLEGRNTRRWWGGRSTGRGTKGGRRANWAIEAGQLIGVRQARRYRGGGKERGS
jgi:hypothetical protein